MGGYLLPIFFEKFSKKWKQKSLKVRFIYRGSFNLRKLNIFADIRKQFFDNFIDQDRTLTIYRAAINKRQELSAEEY